MVALAVGVVVWRNGNDSPKVDPKRPGVVLTDPAVVAADAFAKALSQGKPASGPVVAPSGLDVDGAAKMATAGLSSAATGPPVAKVVKVSHPADKSGPAKASATITWPLDGAHTYSYPVTWDILAPSAQNGLVKPSTAAPAPPPTTAKGWRVRFDVAGLLPTHAAGETIRAVRVPATRGQIRDTTGRSLTPGGTVTIGIRKSRTADPNGAARQAAQLAGVDPAPIVATLATAGPNDFVTVATLERAAYDRIRAQVQPIPGTVFTEQLATTDLPVGYAKALLGRTAPATDAQAKASGGRVRAGESIGVGGVQEGQDAALAGRPGLRVEAAGSAPGSVPRELASWPPVDGTDVTVTLDPKVQAAADATVAATSKPSALVAIRISTGDVLAVANGPSGATFNRAMVGRYPPGSVFKVATGFGLLQKGIGPDTIVNCPATIVMGKRFRNAEGEVLGKVAFRDDFAHSCNTAFISEAKNLSSADLAQVAASLGYRHLDLGVPVFGGSVPVTDNLTEHAADMIGQGKVEASPLVVALASASVAAGHTLEPRLLVAPGATPAPAAALPLGPIGDLQAMMRRVVTSGTGTAAAGVPGGPVSGKTGTAEFGTDNPPRTHAWFTGFQGDIAFAVLVEDGGFGGAVAAPLAASFLRRIAS